jgi:hypothetical protein
MHIHDENTFNINPRGGYALCSRDQCFGTIMVL